MTMGTIRKGLLATVAAGALGLGFGATPAQAASIASLIATYAGYSFDLEDDALESQHIDVNGNGVLDVGDTLRGIGKVQALAPSAGPSIDISSSATGHNELTIIFETIVTGKVPVGAVDINGDGSLDALSLFTFGPSGTFATEFTVPTGSMVVFFEDSTHEYTRSAANGGAACTSVAPGGDCESNVVDGTKVMVLGFTGAGGTAGPGESWGSGLSALPDDPDVLKNLDDSISVGLFTLHLGYLFNTLFTPAPGTLANGSGSVKGSCSIDVLPPPCSPTGTVVTPYPNTADFDIGFQRIPEPASLGLLAVGLLGLGALARRRRAS